MIQIKRSNRKSRQETTEEIMSTIAKRFATLPGTVSACGLAIATCFAGAQAVAQAPANPPADTKPFAPATYSGCVQKAPDSTTNLVISTAKVCALLAGKVSVDTLAGHQVELTGILTPRTASAAASIQVNSVGSVGKSCTEVCALHPPLSRGLHRPNDGMVPGSEGGTPGVVAPQ
jgi:hypothetical protein